MIQDDGTEQNRKKNTSTDKVTEHCSQPVCAMQLRHFQTTLVKIGYGVEAAAPTGDLAENQIKV
jgi:hypothetical protein